MDEASSIERLPLLEELRTRLEGHLATEHEAIGTYEDLVDHVAEPGVRYVVEMILEDERRHHRSLVEIADALARREAAQGAALAGVSTRTARDPELLQATRHLLAVEREDATELRSLARTLSLVPGAARWQLIVRLMEIDTQKHVEMLHFVEAHARGGLELGA
ncbi:MAG TPA: hypothetical protein VMU75_01915 [Acidimicrobiales bacterium]|nr:hypothetical protein [Acidimicrobiales bacterium]